jgi:hypothetical protein
MVRNGANSLFNPFTGSVVVFESDKLKDRNVIREAELLRQKARAPVKKQQRGSMGKNTIMS